MINVKASLHPCVVECDEGGPVTGALTYNGCTSGTSKAAKYRLFHILKFDTYRYLR